MTDRRWRVGLRAIAIAIAMAALIDPVWSGSRSAGVELIAVDATSNNFDSVVASVQAAASGWRIVPRRPPADRVPCGLHERCVVIADGSRPLAMPADAGALSLIIVPPGVPNVSLYSAVATSSHGAASGTVRVEMSRAGTVPVTELRVLDGDALVGLTRHTWSSDRAVVDVRVWPAAAGARVLRVEAPPVDGEVTTVDNELDVGVTTSPAAHRVLVFDARPSWGSTYVRRVLDADARFAVEHRARIAPGLAVGTTGASLDAATLDATPVVIVGGPDALAADEVAWLERYVSRRGGSVMLLPDRKVDGPAAALLGGVWTETLLPAPQPIGPLRASEILRTDRAPVAGAVLGALESQPSIVVRPSGEGRVIISGAMDAWRFRGEAGFARFWSSTVAEAAAEGAALRIDVDATIAGKGRRVRFRLRDRSLVPPAAVEASASVRCGSAHLPVRLWPAGPLNEFAGEWTALESGQCVLDATVGPRAAAAAVAVSEREPRDVTGTLQRLERAVRDAGGVVVHRGSEDDLVRAVDDAAAGSSQVVSMRPLHSPWWIVPFAGCLSIEWWLRRRAGLR